MPFGSSEDRRRAAALACAIALFAAAPVPHGRPSAFLWTAPLLLLAAMFVAWAAESAQFFVAQGFALAILAWLQTLPEFAVEAVLAWHQEVRYLLANLTGALRLLTGVGWPLIYLTAAIAHRLQTREPLRKIRLERDQSVNVVGLLVCLVYAMVIWWKTTLDLLDAAVLIGIYAVYLFVLRRMPPEEPEEAGRMERIPRTIIKARRPLRTAAIAALFATGGLLIYLTAEPFLSSLLALSVALGVPSFVFVQWIAPFLSEFPEMLSALRWARTVERASMALMNMVSSNINQWTLLAAMLPIVFSISRGGASAIPFDARQELELLMTIGQSLLGAMFLMNMQLAWWEATLLFVLWAVQAVLSPVEPGPGFLGTLARHIHWYVTWAYLALAGGEIVRAAFARQAPGAFSQFAVMWRIHVRRR